ncbi:MAG: peptidylprolyl isomerase, partial [Nitrospirae bacterium CG_4_9_14_3_um_filter_51_5]
MSDATNAGQTTSIQIHVNGESWGYIHLKLFPDVAPNHVQNMV